MNRKRIISTNAAFLALFSTLATRAQNSGTPQTTHTSAPLANETPASNDTAAANTPAITAASPQ